MIVPFDAVATCGDAAPPTEAVSDEATSPTTTATSRIPTLCFFLDTFMFPPWSVPPAVRSGTFLSDFCEAVVAGSGFATSVAEIRNRSIPLECAHHEPSHPWGEPPVTVIAEHRRRQRNQDVRDSHLGDTDHPNGGVVGP